MKLRKFSMLALPLVLCGLPSCGVVDTSKDFETSISAIEGASAGTFGIHVHTSTKYSHKLVVSTLVFKSINSKTKAKCSIIWNEYQEGKTVKDAHADWFAQDPTTVFDYDSKKAAVLSYATDQSTGELSIDSIPSIQAITGHASDTFIYTNIYFKTEKVVNAIDSADASSVKYFNVYQSKLGIVDSTAVTIQL